MAEPENTPEAPEVPTKKRAPAGAKQLAALKEKYRLNAKVNINDRGPDGNPLGVGPLLDPQVFDQFASLDKTASKRYLDWMLFMAGGGQDAFDRSRELWGDHTKPKTAQEFLTKFQEDVPDKSVHTEELRDLAERLKTPRLMDLQAPIEQATKDTDLHRRYLSVAKIIAKSLPEANSEKLAAAIVRNKFNIWLRKQLNTRTRDRVHAASVFTFMLQGNSPKQAEQAWREIEPRRRREYIFGDQDNLKWDAFSFARSWPGKNNVYPNIFNEMRRFISNVALIQQHHQKVADYNAKLEQINAGLAPDQKKPKRKTQINAAALKIGEVTVEDQEGNLRYKGAYPTVHALARFNNEADELPMREQVGSDVRYAGPPGTGYAGPKGAHSKTAKIYSDENIDVMVPLTVAAAVEAGHKDWDISDPEQLKNVGASSSRTSSWTKSVTGEHDYPEWRGSQIIHVIFHLKKINVKLLMIAFIDDLVDLHYPFGATHWKINNGPNVRFPEVMKYIRASSDPISVGKSLLKALKVVKHWGQEFDPEDVVGDYLQYYRSKADKQRHFNETIRQRAADVVNILIE